MGKPFRVSPNVRAHIDRKYRRKFAVADEAIRRTDVVMKRAIDELVERAERRQPWADPHLGGLDRIGEGYVHDAIGNAWANAQDEARTQGLLTGHRLARVGRNPKVPPARDLHKLFGDRTFMRRVMTRSEKLTKTLRTAYLKKLKKTWNKVVPEMLSGNASPEDVKKAMQDAWGGSKARVHTTYVTETTNYFVDVQLAYFESEPGILGFLFDRVKDAGTTPICDSRHGLIYRSDTPDQKKLLRENRPGLHYGCRSHFIALANTPANRKLFEDPGRDPTKRKVVPPDPRFKRT